MDIKFSSPPARGQQGEARLVNEWISTFHPFAAQWKRVRLGPLPNKEMASLYKVAQRWVDAVFLENGSVYLVEAKISPDASAIGQLQLYRDLFPGTPEFSAYRDLPLKLVFLTTSNDEAIRRLCDAHEIEYVIYSPEWLKEK